MHVVGIVLVGHAPFATGLLDAATMIFGQQVDVYAKNLSHDTNVDTFTADVQQMISDADSGDGVLVFADLLGGSPGNAASYSMSDRVSIVTGASLPMLLEALGNRHQTLHELVNTAQQAGKIGVVHVNALFENQ